VCCHSAAAAAAAAAADVTVVAVAQAQLAEKQRYLALACKPVFLYERIVCDSLSAWFDHADCTRVGPQHKCYDRVISYQTLSCYSLEVSAKLMEWTQAMAMLHVHLDNIRGIDQVVRAKATGATQAAAR
jgi:hypothetical protein